VTPAGALSVQRLDRSGQVVLDHGIYCPACVADGMLGFARDKSDHSLVVRQIEVSGSDDAAHCAGCRLVLSSGLTGLNMAARSAAAARARERTAMDALADAVRESVAAGMSEVEAARTAGVQRMTVRRWLGKPIGRTRTDDDAP